MSTTNGYDHTFLPVTVPLPHPTDGRAVRELPYVHFTVLLDPARRLAAATGVNIDGAALLDLGRSDDWHLDPRVPASEQAGAELYARNDLDRGHLVRRRDPVWGEPSVAAAANEATFVFTNAAPQAAQFNQGSNLWVGLEDHVLNYARAYEQKISVFTGPVLAAEDVVYRGVQIPRRFWKVAVWTSVDDAEVPTLRSAGFILDQGPSLDDIDLSLRGIALLRWVRSLPIKRPSQILQHLPGWEWTSCRTQIALHQHLLRDPRSAGISSSEIVKSSSKWVSRIRE
jgi:endonuclease G